MRKNRNAFFTDNNMNYQNYNPMIANNPFPNTNAMNSFYAGNIPINSDNNELMERLAKIERQVNRLEHRLNKLESNNMQTTDDYDSPANNMYII